MPPQIRATAERRVLALTKYTARAASTRQRLLLFEPALARAGFRLETKPLFSEADVERIAGGRRAAPLAAMRRLALRLATLALASRRPPDLVWLQMEAFPWAPAFLERAVQLVRAPLIVDCDDAIFHQYDLHPRSAVRRLLGAKLDGVMARAELVTAGNAYLASRARRAGARVEIVPTVVDTARYRTRSERPPGPLTVGWIGSPSTWPYCAAMLPALRPVLAARSARLLVVGAGPAARGIEGLELRDWAQAREAADLAEMDVGLMPLPDDPWARGKCGYKLIQYMAAGLPVVASPVGVNSEIVDHGATGFLAADEAGWHQALDWLLGDPTLRLEMGRAGRARAQERYSLDVWAPRLVELFDETAGPPGAARAARPRRHVAGARSHSQRQA